MTPYEHLFEQYELLTRSNPGWSLTELREIAVRERIFWVHTALYRGNLPNGVTSG